jgi:dTDP-4-amino-4,6-dideoxygalactose transaminase
MTPPRNDGGERTTRRRFLVSSGAVAATWSVSAAARRSVATPPQETLALEGGPKAVTASHAAATTWPRYGKAEEEAILALVRSPSYDPIQKLEQEWKEFFGANYVMSYCNGTSAIAAMLFALDLPPGSEIMVPSYTFFATIVPMRLFGLVPNFVDVDPRTMNFDLDDAKRRLTKHTKAVLPVHWFGLPCDMDHICEWASEKGLIVLEDAAHAHGAKLQGRWMGHWSRMSIFSFQTTKLVPALEGGIGVYENADDCDRATAFGHYDRCHGEYAKYQGSGLGLKLRMHPMAAALAREQLRSLVARNNVLVAQIRRLNERLTQLPGLYEQRTRSDCQRVYYGANKLFLDEKEAGMTRDACLKALQAEGVRASGSAYPLQHKMPLYAERSWWHHPPRIPELPGSEQANATGISLPVFTSEQPELVEQYVRAFEKVWAHRKRLSH